MTLLFAVKTGLRLGLGAVNLALVVLLLSSQALAGEQYVDREGRAIDGYDAVTYFTEEAPVMGLAEITAQYNGATWQFASEANRAAFLANPQRYIPAYDGHCAWAVANGYKARTDPLAYRIVDDQLYLNYDAGIQRRWEGDIEGHIRQSEANWPQIEDEPASAPRRRWF